MPQAANGPLLTGPGRVNRVDSFRVVQQRFDTVGRPVALSGDRRVDDSNDVGMVGLEDRMGSGRHRLERVSHAVVLATS